MGDFERTFGAGADFDAIVSGFSRDYQKEQRQLDREARAATKKSFSSFQEATVWAKNNPGRSFVRCPSGQGFVEK